MEIPLQETSMHGWLRSQDNGDATTRDKHAWLVKVSRQWRCHYKGQACMVGLKTMEMPLQGTSMHGGLRSQDKGDATTRDKHMELYGIALGVARGLEYLHHGCRTRIVHFDIKPQNVLLDGNLCPKVSDFGLAKLCERKESILSLLDTRGTIGYIAPEVFSRVYGRVSHKSDVYSYGMLVLEMIGARTKTSSEDTASSTSSVYFPEWIYKDLEKGNSGTPTGNGISNEEEEIAKKMALVGLWCVQYSPSDRPSMNRVVEMMEGSIDALEVPPRPVLQIPTAPLPESSTVSEDISVYTEVCSMNIA
uniref:Protein kinase domain-containing protein n=1 Tax=Brassica oleracea var. oleracea TaxID=109376 RepID=A0A0D3ANE6_BRAOL